MMNVLLPVDLSKHITSEEFLKHICCYVLGDPIDAVASYIEDYAGINYPCGKHDVMFIDQMESMWDAFNGVLPILTIAILSGRTDTLANSCTLHRVQINAGYINLEVNRW